MANYIWITIFVVISFAAGVAAGYCIGSDNKRNNSDEEKRDA